MPNLRLADLTAEIEANVRRALLEDIGSGDITAQLIPAERLATATIITRDDCVIAGTAWVDAVFRQLDPRVAVHWQVKDGERAKANQALFQLEGPARSLLSGERSALNFLQMLSGVATRAQCLADQVADTQVKLLDTRKTLPGLRLAQKYAVTCGGCHNHRIGLYDAFLIKENHIAASGGIAQAIAAAHRIAPGKPVEIEVESLVELREALDAGADIIMLDELSLDDMREAVRLNAGKAKLEASGGVTEDTLRVIAQTGVDYVSIGAMTKDVKAVDLSMRLSL
ncbi:carboxylating nicotinate-nucleotide diphosphorylase [Pseudomonas tructae]|uniref:Probable nicotinate-nucleotide pyrophosphorylase [carboxylating] n=1 Tax=Pseudomonas tructae TaxID=2518644 RepID=A0A411MEL6_9PSED|nr:carboxylating nicotinate-nucleotide diphosphorylase [Pseudomonas tructae]QBF25200.1 carboxylating nicotinate-nucleotide diphosphorylase [Pseudomonas tructae]